MDKCYGIIYKVTNKVNGKIYIGQTVQSLSKRIESHINKALSNEDDFYFHRAIRKYGKNSFIWEIIIQCNSRGELNRIEIKMIKEYDTFGNGYNLNCGGEGNAGFKHTEEAKRKISESKQGEKNPNYGKYGKDHPNFGKTHTKESKKKISESSEGKNNGMYGRWGNRSPKAKKYIITTPEGKEIFVHGLRNFCKNYKKEKLRHQNLSKVVKGKYKHTKGYKCKYWEEISNEV